MARDARRDELAARLADAYLRARAASHRLRARPFAVIGAPNISDRMADSLRDYAREYLDGSAWGLLDGNGRLELHGIPSPPVESRGAPSALSPPRAPEQVDLFSDLNQWMLKVLLAPRLASALLSAPRPAPRDARRLARLASVSEPHAARLVRHLRREGFLHESGALDLVRVDELLALWAARFKAPVHDLPARWLLPRGEAAAQLRDSLARHARTPSKEAGASPGIRACLGLFAAADALGLGLVSGVAPHLYLEHASAESLEPLGLAIAAPGEPVDVWVRVPRYPESCFRGAVLVDGVPASDVLQCWLDAGGHPARGVEQADFIHDRVLRPSLLRG